MVYIIALVGLPITIFISMVVYICYGRVCRRKQKWQHKDQPSYKEYQPRDWLDEGKQIIDDFEMEPFIPPIPLPTPPIHIKPPGPPPMKTILEEPQPKPKPILEKRSTQQELEIKRRFEEDGIVAELTLSIVFKDNNMLELTVQKIDKIHSSINRHTAYIRVKNPRERKISVPDMVYSKQFDSLLGSHKFSFPFKSEVLQTMKFRFYLWSTDDYSRQREFGEFSLDFGELMKEKDLGQGFQDRYDFKVYDPVPQLGDPSIFLALQYHTRTSFITVTVDKIKDLVPPNTSILSAGIYVKLIFTNTTTNIQKEFKTKVVKDFNPVFNTKFNYRVYLENLEETNLCVEIKAKTFNTETMSVLEFSSNATGRLGEHWMQMIQGITAGQGVEMSHRISQERRSRRVNTIARRCSTTALQG